MIGVERTDDEAYGKDLAVGGLGAPAIAKYIRLRSLDPSIIVFQIGNVRYPSKRPFVFFFDFPRLKIKLFPSSNV